MKIKEVKCKNALSKSKLPGLDYSLNPYRGCIHNCAYCYVPNILRIPREKWGTFVDIKKNIPVILSKELKKKTKGVVGISTVTDPYQPIEKKYRLTRYCLEQLLIHDFPVCIQSKSDLILRDTDIISKFSNAEVMISIGTINDSERKILEPNTSSIKDRLKVLKNFSDIGIKNSIFFGPIYPTIKKEDLNEIIDLFSSVNVKEIMIDNCNLKPGIWENINNRLKQNNHEILKSSLKNIKNQDYYKKIRNNLIEICKNKNIKIVDAF